LRIEALWCFFRDAALSTTSENFTFLLGALTSSLEGSFFSLANRSSRYRFVVSISEWCKRYRYYLY
jgi:hypothetical protein